MAWLADDDGDDFLRRPKKTKVQLIEMKATQLPKYGGVADPSSFYREDDTTIALEGGENANVFTHVTVFFGLKPSWVTAPTVDKDGSSIMIRLVADSDEGEEDVTACDGSMLMRELIPMIQLLVYDGRRPKLMGVVTAGAELTKLLKAQAKVEARERFCGPLRLCVLTRDELNKLQSSRKLAEKFGVRYIEPARGLGGHAASGRGTARAGVDENALHDFNDDGAGDARARKQKTPAAAAKAATAARSMFRAQEGDDLLEYQVAAYRDFFSPQMEALDEIGEPFSEMQVNFLAQVYNQGEVHLNPAKLSIDLATGLAVKTVCGVQRLPDFPAFTATQLDALGFRGAITQAQHSARARAGRAAAPASSALTADALAGAMVQALAAHTQAQQLTQPRCQPYQPQPQHYPQYGGWQGAHGAPHGAPQPHGAGGGWPGGPHPGDGPAAVPEPAAPVLPAPPLAAADDDDDFYALQPPPQDDDDFAWLPAPPPPPPHPPPPQLPPVSAAECDFFGTPPMF